MWYENPLVLPFIVAVGGGAVALIASWFAGKKAKIDATRKEEDLLAELRSLKLQAEITEQKRLDAEKLAAQAATILQSVSEKQDAIGAVLDETHKNTNSAMSALEKVEVDLRAKLAAAELANRTAVESHITAMQTSKELSTSQLALKENKIDELTRQLFTLGLSVIPSLPLTQPPQAQAATSDVIFNTPTEVIVKP